MNAPSPSTPPPPLREVVPDRRPDRRPKTESYGGGRSSRTHPRVLPGGKAADQEGGRSGAILASGVQGSIHGSMLASLLRAPPRKAVRRYVLVELKRADGMRMAYEDLVSVVSCPGFNHRGDPCAKHRGKDPCGALEWEEDVDAKGNIFGRYERKPGVVTQYEVVVAIGSLLEGERVDIVGGLLHLTKWRARGPLTPAEKWARSDEEIREMWQTMEVHETRTMWRSE